MVRGLCVSFDGYFNLDSCGSAASDQLTTFVEFVHLVGTIGDFIAIFSLFDADIGAHVWAREKSRHASAFA